MKSIKEYKVFESTISYSADWKNPKSPIRRELEEDLKDILLELRDAGYHTLVGGWIQSSQHPYVWIKRSKTTGHISSGVIERISDYLKLKGFKTKVEIINGGTNEQIYIYFDRPEEF